MNPTTYLAKFANPDVNPNPNVNLVGGRVEVSYLEAPVPRAQVRLTQAEFNLIVDTQVPLVSAVRFIRAQHCLSLYAAKSVVDTARGTPRP